MYAIAPINIAVQQCLEPECADLVQRISMTALLCVVVGSFATRTLLGDRTLILTKWLLMTHIVEPIKRAIINATPHTTHNLQSVTQ